MKITKTNQTKMEAKGTLTIEDGAINLTYIEKGALEPTVDTISLEDIGSIFNDKEVKITIITQDKIEE